MYNNNKKEPNLKTRNNKTKIKTNPIDKKMVQKFLVTKYDKFLCQGRVMTFLLRKNGLIPMYLTSITQAFWGGWSEAMLVLLSENNLTLYLNVPLANFTF